MCVTLNSSPIQLTLFPEISLSLLAYQASSPRSRRSRSSAQLSMQGTCPSAPSPARRSSQKLSAKSRRLMGLTLCKETITCNDNGRAIGESHWHARYLDEDVARAQELRAQGYSYAEISRMLDMPIRTIRGYIDGSRRCQSVAGWKVVKRWKKVD